MDKRKFFEQMFYNIWQSHALSKFDEYYHKDFSETIAVADENLQPIELKLNYEGLLEQAKRQEAEYQETLLDIKKFVTGEDNHFSVHFYSSSVVKKTGEKRHRWVSGIWHLKQEGKIDRVWAVVTPYYSS